MIKLQYSTTKTICNKVTPTKVIIIKKPYSINNIQDLYKNSEK